MYWSTPDCGGLSIVFYASPRKLHMENVYTYDTVLFLLHRPWMDALARYALAVSMVSFRAQSDHRFAAPSASRRRGIYGFGRSSFFWLFD
jgi:hypothetical protein